MTQKQGKQMWKQQQQQQQKPTKKTVHQASSPESLVQLWNESAGWSDVPCLGMT